MNFRPPMVPIAQAPTDTYAPPNENGPYCPYPTSNDHGHLPMPPLPSGINNRMYSDNIRSSSASPDRHHTPSSSHVLGYDRSRPRQPSSSATSHPLSSSQYQSRQEPRSESPSAYPHFDSSSTGYPTVLASTSVGYPTGPMPMPMPLPLNSQTNNSTLSRLPSTGYPPSSNFTPSGRYPPSSNYSPSGNYPSSSDYPSSNSFPSMPVPVPSTFNQQHNNSNPASRMELPTVNQPYSTSPHGQEHQFTRSRTLPSGYNRPRILHSAPISLAELDDFSLDGDAMTLETPPPSYDDVMREVRHQRAQSMRIRRS